MKIVRLSDTGNGSRVAVNMNTLAQYNAERAHGISCTHRNGRPPWPSSKLSSTHVDQVLVQPSEEMT